MLNRLYRASNPKLAVHTAGLFLFGTAIGIYSLHGHIDRGALWAPLLVYFMWFALFESMFTVLLNNYYDREEDAQNPRKKEYEAVYDDSLFWPYWISIATAVVVFFILYIYYPNEKLLAYVLLLFVANWAYDAPPLRVKTKPPFDVLVGACTQILPPVFGAYALVTGNWPALWALGAAACALCNFEIFHKTFDIEADASMGLRTAATALGLRGSLLLCAVLQLGASVFIVYGTKQPLYALFVVPYLLMLLVSWLSKEESQRRALYGPVQYAYFIVGFGITAFFFFIA